MTCSRNVRSPVGLSPSDPFHHIFWDMYSRWVAMVPTYELTNYQGSHSSLLMMGGKVRSMSLHCPSCNQNWNLKFLFFNGRDVSRQNSTVRNSDGRWKSMLTVRGILFRRHGALENSLFGNTVKLRWTRFKSGGFHRNDRNWDKSRRNPPIEIEKRFFSSFESCCVLKYWVL